MTMISEHNSIASLMNRGETCEILNGEALLRSLQARLSNGKDRRLLDVELLNLSLSVSSTPEEVTQKAKELLRIFGDFGGVLNASLDRLITEGGLETELALRLKIFEIVARRLSLAKILDRPILSNWEDVLRYLRIAVSHSSRLRVIVLFLDSRDRLIAEEEHAIGTVGMVFAYPREIMKRALQLDASSVIIVRNRPGGDHLPHSGDFSLRDDIKSIFKVFDMTLQDYIIIGVSESMSMRHSGLL
jgi:DNA repair protein RadC